MFRFSALMLLASGCGTALNQIATEISPPPARISSATAPQIGITALAPTPSSVPASCSAEATTPTERYAADVVIDLPHHGVAGTLRTTYRNGTGSALSTLVFSIEQARKPGIFTLTSFSTGSSADSYQLEGGRLTVRLAKALLPNCTAAINMGISFKVPAIPEGAAGGFGYFGYSDRQFNLGDWLPVLAPYQNGDWLVPREWNIGETTVTDAASYAVSVTVHGANPDRLLVAGPGSVEHTDATTWRFTLDHARNFALSVSESFIRQTALTSDGVTIEVFSFPHGPGVDAPAQALATARDAASRYAQLFGSVPYPRLVVVQGDFPDGMEFSGIVFVGNLWFNGYEGKPDSYLTLITAHEIAHQWWYSSVGNDQGQHPYLDESLAVYSELLFIESKYPSLVKWWWATRVNLYQPQGYVDSTVYDFRAGRPYINAVYLRGALMWEELRALLGDDPFFRWLRDYARREADQIAAPADLWSLLSSADYERSADIRAHYFHNPDPLGRGPTLTPPATEAPTDEREPTQVKRH